MSTLQHIAQPVLRTRIALVVLAAATAAALTVVLIASAGGGSVSTESSSLSPQKQLQAVSGPRYGLNQGVAHKLELTPAQQLQAVAGARYHVTARASER